MAKRPMVLVSFLAAMLSVATPAMAQADSTRRNSSTRARRARSRGGIEKIDTNPPGTSPYGLYYEEFGTGNFLRGDADFAAYEGQTVTVYGTREFIRDGARIIKVSRIEPAGDGSGETTEEFAGLGIVEAVGERSNGTMGYGLSISPDEAVTWRATSTSRRSRVRACTSPARSCSTARAGAF